MGIQNRTLYFGDNLDILEDKILDNSFDLIYLDPPFNSNRNYNVLFKEGKVDSSAQIHAFEDTWEWTDDTVSLFEKLSTGKNPEIALLINSLVEFIGHNEMMAYLVNMIARLIPLRRVLKSTGSIYLHCDPTASHYLKIVMDVIFGKENFKNEVIWHYKRWPAKTKRFQRMHDIILFYSKSDNNKFNILLQKPTESSAKRWKGMKQLVEFNETGVRLPTQELREQSGGVPMDDVWDISIIAPSAKERLGYPTQKPEALLERIIEASSKKGDWILDPFCGCGTTVAVAEKLKRNWVGIDISMLAINVIAKRMAEHFPRISINIDGIPMDYAGAQKLAERDKYAFQDWAISLIGANPPGGEAKKGADSGIDGIILFKDKVEFDNPNPRLRKILVQVKGGHHTRANIATLKGDIDREDAPMGVLITLNEPTMQMKKEASLSGEYKYSDGVSFPKIQILSIKDWFEGKRPILPTNTVNPFKTANEKADQVVLFNLGV